MKLSRFLGLGVLAVVAVVLAACGGTESGTLSPSGDSTSTGTQPPSDPVQADPGDPDGQAPSVKDPLDPELLLSEPCDLLTSSQRDELDLTEDEFYVDDFGDNVCKWRTTDDDAPITISADESLDEGLDDVYDQHQEAKYFEPVAVNGYPAVFTANLGTPDDGNCQLFVGTTDQDVARVSTRIPSTAEGDPCELAHNAAEVMIDTLKD